MSLFEQVKDAVSIYDLLDRTNPPVRYETQEKPCKINCPFHGADVHKSCQVFPESNSIWCYTCSRGWDVLDYWAEANGWWREKDKKEVRDVAKAARDLADEYGVENDRTDWEKKFYSLRKEAEQVASEYQNYSLEERERLRDYYSWRVGGIVFAHGDNLEWAAVEKVWDQFLVIKLDKDDWKTDLTNWFESAKLVL